MPMWCVAPLEMNEGKYLGARVQSAYRLQCRKAPHATVAPLEMNEAVIGGKGTIGLQAAVPKSPTRDSGTSGDERGEVIGARVQSAYRLQCRKAPHATVAPLEMNEGKSLGARVQSAYRLQCRKGPTRDL